MLTYNPEKCPPNPNTFADLLRSCRLKASEAGFASGEELAKMGIKLCDSAQFKLVVFDGHLYLQMVFRSSEGNKEEIYGCEVTRPVQAGLVARPKPSDTSW